MRQPLSPVVLLAAMLFATTACSKRVGEAGGPVARPSMEAPTGAMLAYEHSVEVELPADGIGPRLAELQAACTSGTHGRCQVLDVGQQGGDHPRGDLTVRIEPRGVEPMIALAAGGGELGARRTHAEDLATVVQDNARLLERLKREHAQLEAFQQRGDLDVAGMIALSSQMAEVEARLQQAEQEAAGHALRIETQKLSFALHPPAGASGRNEIAGALRDFGATLALGTAWTIRSAAFLIPLGLLGAALVGTWKWWRRRRAAGRGQIPK